MHWPATTGTRASPPYAILFLPCLHTRIMDCEVIVSTYNNLDALDRVLLAIQHQDRSDFGICVADDGSGPATTDLADAWRERLAAGRLRHVWQPDDGFQKNRILNRAIASSHADYLIFIDGDCVARTDFVGSHLRRRQRRAYLSGGMVRLSHAASAALDGACIADGSAFTAAWLRNQCGGLGLSLRLKGALLPRRLAEFLEFLTPVRRTWNGANSSGWRSDIVAVNGFDERLRYGAEDVEMGVRLVNSGVRALQLRYSAALLHLDHSRPYADGAAIASNHAYVATVRQRGLRWTEHGIHPGAQDASRA